jgi:hypothetical protein
LAVLSINLCRVVDPEVIVFGGGLAKAGKVLLDLIRKYVKEKTWTVLPTDVQLTLAVSDKAGVLGPALAAKQRFGKTHLLESLAEQTQSQPTQQQKSFPPLTTSSSSSLPSSDISNNMATWLGAGILVSTTALWLTANNRSNNVRNNLVFSLALVGQGVLGVYLVAKSAITN